MTQQKCETADCKKWATYEIRHVDRGVISVRCKDHRGSREYGVAPFKIGEPECSAVLEDGLPCNKPAKFVVTRSFSGVQSICCGTHRPKHLHIAQGAVRVESIGGVGA